MISLYKVAILVYATNIQRLQRVLNSAARVVCLSPKFDHITPHLIELYWLPVKARISFKVLLLVYEALNGMAPSYLADIWSDCGGGTATL
jgi:hypothetical protein